MTVRLDEILKGIKPYVLGWITAPTSMIMGSGTSGKLAKFVGTQTIGDSIVTETQGGVTTLVAEVAGGGMLAFYVKSTGDHYIANALQNSGRLYYWHLVPSTDAPASRLRLMDGTVNTERLTLLTNGNVGVGTANPGAKLHVGGDALVDGGVTVDASGANTGTLTSALRFGSSASTEGIGSNRAAGTNQNGVDIFTASTRRISVTSGGNVGIGIASPGAKLHVSAGDVLLDNNQAYRMKDTSGNAQALLKVSAGNRVNFGSLSSIPGGGQVEFYNSGVLGGTLDGNRDWQMEKGVTVDASGANTGALTSALRFGSSSSTEGIGSNRSAGGNNQNGVDIFTASTRRLSVTSGGNVGVNIYNPSEKLQVAGGNILIDRDAFYKAKEFNGTARGLLRIDADNRVDVGSIEALSYDGSIRFWVQAVVAGRFALTTRRFEASYGADITGDLSLNAGDKASGSGVMAIANRTAAPSGTPSGGGVLYAEAGALKWKGSGGTITTIAPA